MQEHSIKGTGIGIDLSVSRASIILFFYYIFAEREIQSCASLYLYIPL